MNPLSLVLKLKPGVAHNDVVLPLSKNPAAGTGPTTILHFAWIVPLAADTLLLSTVYDGEFGPYLDAFIDANPDGFNQALPRLVGAPPPPITDPVNRQAFHDFVAQNNLAKTQQSTAFFSAYPKMTVIKILRCEHSS
jgi:hypothetical protein